ncbi:hypothetical protein [Falsirhodobacter sp. 20TX0035]|uniref:hypothetical protein n=1 Tax=Falsirhodobacter sp. 20TX0035 TaxID=3022019 RepID=UPI00232D2550|nr:hypothetical protein [Falsirhodobacter sp. 20TX0035]MDB6454286.1 hypothetical protein [Falsirhodobacter sp. 20TX0035]
MRQHLLSLVLLGTLALAAQPSGAQFATLPSAGTPMVFSPPQCNALREVEDAVATRSADDIERIGAAMDANRNASPAEVARISGLSVPTVTTMGALDQQQGMAFSLVFGSMLRQFHPDLLMKVLRERGPLGQVPDVSSNPLGLALLDGLMNTAQQSYLTQCS